MQNNRKGPKGQDKNIPPLNRAKAKVLPDGTFIKLYETKDVIDPVTGQVYSMEIEYPEPDSICCNPWGLHALKCGYLYWELTETEAGNILCSICWERNERNMTLNRLFGWLYTWNVY